MSNLSTTRFGELPLAPALLDNLASIGFEYCTPIQAEALPILLDGHDVAGQAQTGTGKTATFLLALLHRLLTVPADPERQPNQPRALVVAPTRELVVQIHKDAVPLAQGLGLKLGLVFGGVDYDKQRTQLAEGVDVLIGTPGRLIDYFKQKVYDLRHAEVLVLDEADRMFDLGFIKDIRFLLRRLPPPEQRLSMLFSATLSMRVSELAYEHMSQPVPVAIAPEQVTADRVKQMVYHVANNEKVPLLVGLMREMQPERALVFVNTKHDAERVNDYLELNGISSGLMTGDVMQRKRLSLLNRFQTGEVHVLVATDVAARGLHIDNVTHVFNYDLPQDAEDYVHRIGRTARAGASGTAVSFGCETYVYSLPEIEDYIGQKIPMEVAPSSLMVEVQRPPRRERSRGARNGRGGRPDGGGRARSSGRGGRRPAGGAQATSPSQSSDSGHDSGSSRPAPGQQAGQNADQQAGDSTSRSRRRRRSRGGRRSSAADTQAG